MKKKKNTPKIKYNSKGKQTENLNSCIKKNIFVRFMAYLWKFPIGQKPSKSSIVSEALNNYLEDKVSDEDVKKYLEEKNGK